MNNAQYNKFLESDSVIKSGLTVIVTTITPQATINNILKRLLDCKKLNIEILVYEDKSKDNTLSDFCSKNNIHYYRIKENESTNNPCFGRFDGIKKATQNFITFIDGDDELLSSTEICYIKCIDLLENYIPNVNVCAFGTAHKNEITGKVSLKKLKEEYISSDVLNYTIGTNIFSKISQFAHAYVWNKIYRSSILKTFDKIYSCWSEDTMFNMQVLFASNSFRTGFVNLIGYCHNYGADTHLAVQQYLFKKNPERYIAYTQEFERFITDYDERISNCHSNTIKHIFAGFKRRLKKSQEILTQNGVILKNNP